MTVTLPNRRPVAGSLREMAERMDELQGYWVEIIGGTLVMSPTPSKKHNGIVKRVMRQLDDQLPDDRESHPVSSVEAGDDGEDYCSPDLIVVPLAEDYEDGWLYEADLVDLALEVVSPGNPENDIRLKPAKYASWGIPIYLVVDPRDGSLMVYSDPLDGRYRGCHRMRFGDVVTLPEPLKDIRIETADLPRYDG